MYHMTEGSKQSFSPFDYPSHYQPPIIPTPHSQPFYLPLQQLFSPMQIHSYPSLNSKHHRPPIMNAFLKHDGSFDFEKTFQTVNQITSTFQQVSPLVKQVGSLFKLVK